MKIGICRVIKAVLIDPGGENADIAWEIGLTIWGIWVENQSAWPTLYSRWPAIAQSAIS